MALVPDVGLAGDYIVTFIADPTCTDLPTDLRTRTYLATIGRDPRGAPDIPLFHVPLTGASFFRTNLGYHNSFVIRTAGEYLAFVLDEETNPITEQLARLTYLTLTGSASTSVAGSSPSAISLSFEGRFDYCVQASDVNHPSPCVFRSATSSHATCTSRNHRVTLTRR